MAASELPDPALDVWPENWQAVKIFDAVQTQWRHAPFGGIVGLDYAALPPVLEMLGINRDYWRARFAQVRLMEHAVLHPHE